MTFIISKAILFLLLITLKNINCSHLGLKTSKEHSMARKSPNFFVLVVMYKEDNRVLSFYVIHKTSISREAIFYANYYNTTRTSNINTLVSLLYGDAVTVR